MNPRALQVLLFGGTALVLGGCAVSTVAPPVTPAVVAASRGSTAQELNRGRELFSTRCTACHSADPVADHSVADWNRIVGEMAERSKLRSDERAALLAYISAAHATLPSPTASR